MVRRIIIGLVLALLVALPATAQDLKKGVAAYKGVDSTTALRELRPLAEKGNAEAQTYLGIMYRYGRSVPQMGEGVPQDYKEAVRLFRLHRRPV
jgi:TPR repeat protein